MGRYAVTGGGNYLTKFVNMSQTAAERREKYWLARSCGRSHAEAYRMRDWRLSRVEKALGLRPVGDPAGHETSG